MTTFSRLASPRISLLGPDPTHFARDSARTHVLNGNAFQQDVIVTFAGWQYAAFYSATKTANNNNNNNTNNHVAPVFVHLARRKLSPEYTAWQTFVFDDYPQTTDDGHNTIQLGICPGDGTIHLSYDHHCDRLRYRHSVPKLALDPEAFQWTSANFTSTLSTIPGLSSNDPEIEALLGYVTYPRFGVLGTSKLWFSFRTGKAGLGDDHLAVYDPATASYSRPVTHLKGVDSNPYINGLDYRECANISAPKSPGRLYTTWVYRGFVWYPGWDDPNDTKHKAQAGPNSADNNHDLCFAYSEDEGATWRNGAGEVIAEKGSSIEPASPGIRAFEIPKKCGLANQESQAVDHDGGIHVLNKDCLPTSGEKPGDELSGQTRWKHYYRDPKGTWTQTALPDIGTLHGGKRGQVAVSKNGDLYFILPTTTSRMPTTTASSPPSQFPTRGLTIMKASRVSNYTDYHTIWSSDDAALGDNAHMVSAGGTTSEHTYQGHTPLCFPPTEILVDKARLDHDDVLSVFARVYHRGSGSAEVANGSVDVVVLDFTINSQK